MKRRWSLAMTGLVVLTGYSTSRGQPGAPPPPVGANVETVDVSTFYEPLATYGEWIEVAPYGWVWSPHGVTVNWQPYQLGRWVWTNAGWTWVSDEPFGWATYHYGRWYYHPYHGWVWLPGTQWSPAWVAWRQGDGWIGWAPMPPEDRGRPGISIRIGNFNLNIGRIHTFSWTFVEEGRLCEPSLRRYIARQPRNASIILTTRDVTSYTIASNVVINRSVPLEVIERRYGRPVPRYVIRETTSPITRTTVITGSDVTIYRPKFVDRTPTRAPTTIITGKPRITVDSRRLDAERRALAARGAAERAALEDRQRRERDRKLTSEAELRRRHAEEQAALREQVERERKLLERSNERITKGQIGPTRTTDPKYTVLPPSPPPTPPAPPPTPPRTGEKKPKTRR